jgi:osmotically-inducible protein OsmY
MCRTPTKENAVTSSDEDRRRREIEAKVLSTLRSEPRLGPTFHLRELRFDRDGVVLLDGEVPDVAAKKTALEKVAAIPGIDGIADRLHVKPATHMTDKEIRVHVRNSLTEEPSFASLEIRELENGEWHLMRGAPAGTRGSIDIEVHDGVVVLDGRVPGLTSKRLAGVIAWWVPGVRDVFNGIEVGPPEDDSPDLIAEAVRVVLEKDPFVNASQIGVGVRNTLVRLTGLVPNETERQAAERDVWMVFGVDTVVNEIRVQA